MQYVLPCLVSFLLTLCLTPIVIRLATACRCLDMPGRRHVHKKPTPRWGGLAFYLGVLPVLFALKEGSAMSSYIAASFLLVGIGIIDDRYGLGWKIKFAGNIAAATIVIFGGNTVVRDIGTYGAMGSLELGRLSVPFTYFGIVGVTNAINLLDGLNGLAGGVSLLGFLFLGIAALLAGNIPVALICFAFVGALAAFLVFNFPRARTFMGDSGSMFLGFSLAVFSVHLTQDARFPVEPMYPILVLMLPIFDALRVMIIRILRRKNPFKADKGHLHHLLVRTRMSSTTAVVLLWGFTIASGINGLVMLNKTSMPFLVTALYGALFLGLFTETLVLRKARKRHGAVGFPLTSSRPYGYAGIRRSMLSPDAPLVHASVRSFKGHPFNLSLPGEGPHTLAGEGPAMAKSQNHSAWMAERFGKVIL